MDMIIKLVVFILLYIIVIDLKYMIIPDKLNLSLVILGIIMLIYSSNKYYYIIGAMIGFLVFLIIAVLTDAMGGGDIKLMTALGLIFGIKGVMFITIFSFITGAIISVLLLLLKIKNRNDKIPFGPFISLSAMLYMCKGEEIISWYLGLFM